MFVVMVTGCCLLAIQQGKTSPTFIPPDIAAGALFSWWLSGVPYRYCRRRNAGTDRQSKSGTDSWG
jgi:hypothetical protein